jgi:plastocyanin
VLVAAAVGACDSGPTAPSAAATITIGQAGVSPSEVRIKSWSYVRFVNNDTRPHSIVSDPVDAHSQCPPLNRVGLLQPGESRDTGTLNLPGVCGFHDHGNQGDAGLKGRIVVE